MNSNVSALQSQLALETMDMEAFFSTQRQLEKKKRDYMDKIVSLVTDRRNLKDPTKEQLHIIESEIDFYKKLKTEVTDELNQIISQHQEREEKLGDVKDLKDSIFKLEMELRKLQEMKGQANYFKGTTQYQ